MRGLSVIAITLVVLFGGAWVGVIGRLRPEATLEGARAELDPVYRAIMREYPSPIRDRTLRVASLRDNWWAT